jgi:hypothetical protein
MKTYHWIDAQKGRASVRKMWTRCGRPVRSRYVLRSPDAFAQVTCEACLQASLPPVAAKQEKQLTGTVNSESPDLEKEK